MPPGITSQFAVDLPPWALEEQERLPPVMPELETRMATVIRFAELNFEHDTGGPFAAGVFERDSGKLVLLGVNRVVPCGVSLAHAEMVTLALAQKQLKTFDLGGPGMPAYQLVVNGRPCSMCCGALHWSGIRSLVVGASGEQIESLAGFDEGPIHPHWQQQLRERGIEVAEGVLADRASDVFARFRDSGQPIYNGRSGME